MIMSNAITIRSDRAAGFTLVEVAIVVLIVGLAIATAASAYDQWAQFHRQFVTKRHMSLISDAVERFIDANGRLPCVARADVTRNDPAYGVETDCAAPAGPGVTSVAGRDGIEVRIGTFPVRAIEDTGLPPEQQRQLLYDRALEDGWHQKTTYAVTVPMAANANGYRNGLGAIFVNDAAGNSVVLPAGQAMYALVSHGADGVGAGLPYSTALVQPCSAGSGLDVENCDGDDAVFVRSLLYSENPGAAHFDDFTAYRIKDEVLPLISRYIFEEMECKNDLSEPDPANVYGRRCSTALFTGQETTVTDLDDIPTDGILLYQREITAQRNGKMIVSATIPTRYRTAHVGPTNSSGNQRWEQALIAAIFVNGELKVLGDLVNPYSSADTSAGGAGTVIGFADIVQDQTYGIDIYVFSLGNTLSDTRSGWAGTIRLADHDVVGVVEIMETAVEFP